MSKKNQKAEGDTGSEATIESAPEVTASQPEASGGPVPKGKIAKVGETPHAYEGETLPGIEIDGRLYPDLETASLNENIAMETIGLRIASDLYPEYKRV